MFHCNLHWIPRYCLVAKNFWVHCQSWPLYTNSAAKKRRSSSSLSLLSSYDLKKDRSWQISLPKCWTLKSLNVEKITSAISMQCSNQYQRHLCRKWRNVLEFIRFSILTTFMVKMLVHLCLIIYFIYGSGFYYIYGGYYIYGWLSLHLWLVLLLFNN